MPLKPSVFKKLAGLSNIQLGKIKDEQKLDFAQDLRLLINSGVPIQEGLAIILNQAKQGRYKTFLMQAKEKVERGSSLYSVCKESGQFDPVFVNFIKVGEETGNLAEALNFLFEWLDNRLTLKREISSVTLYPKMLIVFSLIVVVILSVFILPNVVKVIEDLNVEPFITTVILLAISGFMVNYGIYVAAVVLLSAIFFSLSPRMPFVKKIIDGFLIRFPVVGSLFRDYQLTVISQIGFTLYRSGIPATQIFRIVSEASSNFYYKESMRKITESVEKGTNPSRVMALFPKLYPGTFVNVIAVGEKAGTLEQSFSYLARFFQVRLFRRTRLLPTIIEPVLLIIIGLFIAFVASAIILPIYDVTKGI